MHVRRQRRAARGFDFGLDIGIPVGRKLGAGVHDYVRLNAPGWIVRRIVGLAGRVELAVEWRPTKDFGATPVELIGAGRAVRAGTEMPTLYADADVGYELDGDLATATVTIVAGQTRRFVVAGLAGSVAGIVTLAGSGVVSGSGFRSRPRGRA